MERGLAMAAAFGAAMDERESSPSSRSSSSSGCQSGWTLYLDHSNGGARHVPCGGDHAAGQRWMMLQQAADHAGGDEDDDEEDSMASDASSGPRLRPGEEEHEEARRDGFGLRRHEFFVVDDQRASYDSGTSGQRSRGSASGSGCLGSSTWSRSSQGGVATKAAVVTATRRQYREIIGIDDDDELDDTASSSAIFSCPTMMHAR